MQVYNKIRSHGHLVLIKQNRQLPEFSSYLPEWRYLSLPLFVVISTVGLVFHKSVLLISTTVRPSDRVGSTIVVIINGLS